MTKTELMEEAFRLGGNHNLKACKAMETKLQRYVEKHPDDLQVRDVLLMVKMYIDEHEFSDPETSRKFAAPIIERLSGTDKWEFCDIRVLATVVDFADTYSQFQTLVEMALERLEEYSYEEKYSALKRVIHMNSTYRLLKARYFKTTGPDSPEDLEKEFSKHVNAALTLCDEFKFPIHRKAVLVVRKGLFYKDDVLIDEGLNLLKEAGEHDLYKMMQGEVREFEFYVDNILDEDQVKIIFGRNLRKLRNYYGMSIKYVAKIMNIYPASVGVIERGKNGTRIHNLFNLSKIFGVPADSFFSPPEIEEHDGNKESLIEEATDLIKSFSVSELKFIIATCKDLRILVSNKINSKEN